MNKFLVLFVLGNLLLVLSAFMLFCAGCAFFFQDGSQSAFLYSFSLTFIAGMLLRCSPKSTEDAGPKEGFAIVTFTWIAIAVFGGFPFMFSELKFSFTDGFFEAMSGFTTTGASVLTDIEGAPKTILLYRAITHWLGGLGIVVLSLAILPSLGIGGMQLFKAEVPGPTHDKFTPRLKDTARILWQVYLVLTLTQIAALLLGGMDLFDSISHTFATLSTGGFSTKNSSVFFFRSEFIDYVISLFMFLAGINFALHYRLFFLADKSVFYDEEFLFYLLIVIIFSVLIALNIYYSGTYNSLRLAFQYSLFTVLSIFSATGFATADYETWPLFSQGLIFFLMFCGGCAGSTSGGVKCIRLLLIGKAIKSELYRILHPRAFLELKHNNKILPQEVIRGIFTFSVLYYLIFALGSLLFLGLNLDWMTSFSLTIASLGNIGPGFSTVGPTDNYAHLPDTAKWISSFLMLLGRLEIMTVLLLFHPETWKK